MPEWVIPWIVAAVVIYPLIRVERWIHRHIQGLGLLLTNNAQAAVLIYYLILFPGVFIHELSQWLLAQALRVKIKKFRLWPEEQQKVIRLGLVEIDQRRTDMYRSTAIGIIPLVVGVIIVSLIARAHFDIQPVLNGLQTGDLTLIGPGIKQLTSAPDFWLWFYLVFAIANAMLPEPHDEVTWWLPVVGVAILAAVLIVLDNTILLVAFLDGPLLIFAQMLSITLVTALVIDLFMMFVLWAAEEIFSRVLNRELEYS